jgi:small GTP-binding protein
MFKLLIVGESGVGKTCMLLRFADNLFEPDFLSTIGVDFKVKELLVDNKRVKLQIWDSAGQERFRNITASYYRGSSGIIIVYDVTKSDSFDKVTEWITEVRRFVPNVPIVLVGNKCDMEDERQVPTEDGECLARSQDLVFLETSAKANTNIEAAFEKLTRKLMDAEAKKPSTSGPSVPIPIDSVSKKQKQNRKRKLCKA